MIFTLLVIALVGVIAFFNYIQGLFSATLSAVMTVLAAVMALAYHEQIVGIVMKGNLADAAHSIVLSATFAVTYLILRVIFDRTIPGNVRYPLLLDKIGAGVMGLICGLFATGIFVIAAQMLPFGPSVMGYARFDVKDREVTLPPINRSTQSTSIVFDELNDTEDPINPTKAKSLLFPVDDLVVGAVNKLSDGGSLAGDRPLASIHPDWINEIFGQRLGMQAGTRHVLLNIPNRMELKDVDPVYTVQQINEIDSEFSQVRGPYAQVKKKGGDVLKPSGDQMLLIVRCHFDINATDEDKMMRISPGAVRLLGVGGEENKKVYVNYTPLGTVDGDTLYRNRPDDPIVVNLTADGYVDFLFLVNKTDLLAPGDPKSGNAAIKPGVFFEAKRVARIDLAGKPVGDVPQDTLPSQVLRKELEKAGEGRAGGRASNAPVVKNAPLTVKNIALNPMMFNAVNPGSADGNFTVTSGNGTLKDKKFVNLRIDGTESLQRIGMGDYATKELYARPDERIIQVQATPSGDDPWKWADDMAKWQVMDGSERKYNVHGVFVNVALDRANHLVAEWKSDNQIDNCPRPEGGRPVEVWLAFVVPAGENVKDFLYEGKSVKKTSVEAK